MEKLGQFLIDFYVIRFLSATAGVASCWLLEWMQVWGILCFFQFLFTPKTSFKYSARKHKSSINISSFYSCSYQHPLCARNNLTFVNRLFFVIFSSDWLVRCSVNLLSSFKTKIPHCTNSSAHVLDPLCVHVCVWLPKGLYCVYNVNWRGLIDMWDSKHLQLLFKESIPGISHRSPC